MNGTASRVAARAKALTVKPPISLPVRNALRLWHSRWQILVVDEGKNMARSLLSFPYANDANYRREHPMAARAALVPACSERGSRPPVGPCDPETERGSACQHGKRLSLVVYDRAMTASLFRSLSLLEQLAPGAEHALLHRAGLLSLQVGRGATLRWRAWRRIDGPVDKRSVRFRLGSAETALAIANPHEIPPAAARSRRRGSGA
jgi:hypothetical protein